MELTLLHKGSLITFQPQGGDKEQCLGYLMHFQGHGVYEPTFGKVDVTPSEADAHNAALSGAEIQGLDANCRIGMGGTFYMGATGGGVWKTVDYGQNWVNVSDGFFASPSIGAIRVAPSIPSIIYVGTGSDGIRSNIITGRGVYKSVDGGRNWEFLGLRDAGQIGAVEVHPTNPDIVFVAAIGQAFGPNPDRGVFRSRDGGSRSRSGWRGRGR